MKKESRNSVRKKSDSQTQDHSTEHGYYQSAGKTASKKVDSSDYPVSCDSSPTEDTPKGETKLFHQKKKKKKKKEEESFFEDGRRLSQRDETQGGSRGHRRGSKKGDEQEQLFKKKTLKRKPPGKKT